MKRFLSILLTAIMLLGMAAIPASAAEATPVTFWTFQASHQKFLESAALRWNEAYPDRPIEFKGETLGYDDLHNNLLISLQTGTGAPDMVDIEIAMYANFITGEEEYIPLVPLNSVVEPDRENLIIGRFDNYANHGNYYGVDYHVGAAALMYNKEIFAESG
ncbi:MAG: ABC transporter substrate-binding protein, partial [Eubacteriales bacterium]|nr:ABC transporter substrate-binding protein [Eubacteriales bacterium]